MVGISTAAKADTETATLDPSSPALGLNFHSLDNFFAALGTNPTLNAADEVVLEIIVTSDGIYTLDEGIQTIDKNLTIKIISHTESSLSLNNIQIAMNTGKKLNVESSDDVTLYFVGGTIELSESNDFTVQANTTFADINIVSDKGSRLNAASPVYFSNSEITFKESSTFVASNPVTFTDGEISLEKDSQLTFTSTATFDGGVIVNLSEGSILASDLTTTINEAQININNSTLFRSSDQVILGNDAEINLAGTWQMADGNNLQMTDNTVFNISGEGQLEINTTFPGKLTFYNYRFIFSNPTTEAKKIKIEDRNSVYFNDINEWIPGKYEVFKGEIVEGDYNNIAVWINVTTKVDPSKYSFEYDNTTPGAETLYLVIKEEPAKDTYTVTLEIAPGIDLQNQRPGDLTVEEGGKLTLLFRPEDRTETANEVLLLVDGVETDFKDLGGDYYHSYTLTVDKDHSILIAMKEYPVTLPATFSSVSGSPYGEYGKPFVFRTWAINDDDVEVFINGTKLIPYYENPLGINQQSQLRSDTEEEAEIPEEGEYEEVDPNYEPDPEVCPIDLFYLIEKITGPVTVTAIRKDPTGNTEIAGGNFSIAIDNGQLTMDNYSGKAVDVVVYNFSGQIVATRKVSGTTTIALSPGIYIVRAAGETYKVVVP